uniref:Uncharacterized protein n=1 Tax=Labrus bergylta TaxID=56723 RepID=A0A3Q3N4Q9_9LABR
VSENTLLHGEALLVVTSADAHHVTLQNGEPSGYITFIQVIKVRNLRSSSTSISFWQPVAGKEISGKHCTFILLNRPYDGPPRKRDRISSS